MIATANLEELDPQFHVKVWGTSRTEPWFTTSDDIGEVCFPADDLLIKFIFTSQNLSVQVHPDDEYALVNEDSRGKTEMWYILRADPGASIALGFRDPISRDRLTSSARDGSILELLNWFEVQPGDAYFVPAGTVHAIGAGIVLCEIQQNSDLTYRLYDYGRGRPLHLDHAESVSALGIHPGKCVPTEVGNTLQLLVESPYFRTYRAIVDGRGKLTPPSGCRLMTVAKGSGTVDGSPVHGGQVFRVTAPAVWDVAPEGPLTFLLTG